MDESGCHQFAAAFVMIISAFDEEKQVRCSVQHQHVTGRDESMNRIKAWEKQDFFLPDMSNCSFYICLNSGRIPSENLS